MTEEEFAEAMRSSEPIVRTYAGTLRAFRAGGYRTARLVASERIGVWLGAESLAAHVRNAMAWEGGSFVK